MRPLSVAVVAACQFPVNYGSPGAIRELSAALSEMDVDIHVVTYPHGEDLPVGKAKLHRVARGHRYRRPEAGPTGEKLYLDFLMIGELCRTVWRQKIDLIHGHNYEGALIGLLGKFITRKPMVYQSVCLMADELASYRFIKPVFLAKWLGAVLDWLMPIFPDHIITVTQELYDYYAKRGVPKRKLSMITSGIDPEMFAQVDPDRFRKKYGLGSCPVVMYTGITNHFQRIDYLLRAFSIVIKEVPSAMVVIVNPLEEQPDVPELQALARELKITENVVFAGPHTLAELPDYLAMATVTVAPRPECPGHPIKLLNYMISGKPIVCFAGGAKGLTDMQDALVVADHNWQAMGDAILTFLRDPELAKKLGDKARENAIKNFDWRAISEKVAVVFDRILNRTPERVNEDRKILPALKPDSED